MTAKERYMTSLKSIADYAYRANIGPNGINEINEDYNKLKKLIEEHFTPQSLKLSDLHENMWVFDSYLKCAIYITKIENNHIKSKFEHLNNPIEDKIFCMLSGGVENNTYFEKNRFYPIQIPKVMEE